MQPHVRFILLVQVGLRPFFGKKPTGPTILAQRSTPLAPDGLGLTRR